MGVDKTLSVVEVAQMLSLSKNTVYAMVNRGELNSYRIGKKLRFTREDVNDYIAKSRHETQTAPVRRIQVESTLLNSMGSGDSEFVISGQDVVLDVLTNFLNQNDIHAIRAYLGSFEGLLSLYQDRVQVATSHLWDSYHDDYNTEYVKWLMPGIEAVIINITYRWQGFYVQKGNPKQILDYEDLLRPGVRFLNRRKGSGGRILLDGKLRQRGLRPENIRGYDEEIGSHLSLASAIVNGEADVGIGTERVTYAKKGLDFLPLQRERYDMVIKKSMMDTPQVQGLLQVLNSEEFRCEISCVSGNDYTDMGKIIAEV